MSRAFWAFALWAGCSGDSSMPRGAEALLANSTYTFVQDSDGQNTPADSAAFLVFEPSGVADLYLPSDAGPSAAYRGSYGFDGAHMRLVIPQIHVDTELPIVATDDMATLPFAVYSTTATSSLWQRNLRPLDENLFVVFNMALFADGLDVDAAIDRAVDYGNQVAAISLDAAAVGTASIGIAAVPKDKPPCGKGGSCISSVKRVEGFGLIIYYLPPVDADGNLLGLAYKEKVNLVSWLAPPQTGAPLVVGPIKTDLHIDLATNSPLNNAADPIEKTALFVEPFRNLRSGPYIELDSTTGKFVPGLYTPVSNLGAYSNSDEMAARLGEHGYRVQQLSDDQVTIEGLTKALLPLSDPAQPANDRQTSPGLIIFYTHGTEDGSLFTGEFLQPNPPPPGAIQSGSPFHQAVLDLESRLSQNGLDDLVKFENGDAFELGATFDDKLPSPARAVVVTPAYWRYLRTRSGPQADFQQSFVFIAACDTAAKNDDLRDAIQSRAYWAFNNFVNARLGGAIFQYLIQDSIDHTHSAEEAFYNVLRVGNTRTATLCHDNVFDDAFKPQLGNGGVQTTDVAAFRGWGWDGTQELAYFDAGWLSIRPVDDVGSVWWLLFGGRWSQNAQPGWDDMARCWSDYWSSGKPDTSDVLCHSKNPGYPPTPVMIDYASYLLTGTSIATGGSVPHIPRWTLNDGDADVKLKLGCCPSGTGTGTGICLQ